MRIMDQPDYGNEPDDDAGDDIPFDLALDAGAMINAFADLSEAEKTWVKIAGQRLFKRAREYREEGGENLGRPLRPLVVAASLAYALRIAKEYQG
jgi:hypothetical protein